MNKNGAASNVEEEFEDGTQDDANQEDQEAGLDQEGNPNSNEGREDSSVTEGDESNQEGDEEDGGGGVDESAEKIARLEAEIEKLKKTPAREERPQFREPTEEEWLKHEEATGLSRVALKFQAQQFANLHSKFKKMINDRMAKFEKENAIVSLAKQKGFSDISRYRKGIDEFLADYDESVHSNEDLLRKGYYFAKGKGSPEAVRRAANQTERNKRIAVNGRPASPNAGPRKQSVQLTSQQRALAKRANMSESEYASFLPKRKK